MSFLKLLSIPVFLLKIFFCSGSHDEIIFMQSIDHMGPPATPPETLLCWIKPTPNPPSNWKGVQQTGRIWLGTNYQRTNSKKIPLSSRKGAREGHQLRDLSSGFQDIQDGY
jgi:hypothetical protein